LITGRSYGIPLAQEAELLYWTPMTVDKLRFGAKAGDGRCSALWIAFTKGSDLYLGARSVAAKLKLSLHADGNCHIAVDYNYYRRLPDVGVPRPPDRHFARWRMPAMSDSGAVHVASVIFPTRFLRTGAPLELNKSVFWEGSPDRGALEVGFFYGKHLLDQRSVGPAVLRFRTSLSDGRVVMVITRCTDFAEERILEQSCGQHRMYAFSPELWALSPGQELKDADLFAWNDVKDGEAVAIWAISGANIRRNA
jgi:hypothetical protein